MTHEADPAVPPTTDVTDVTDERFELLSNARRRLVLYELYRAGTALDVDELSAAVAAAERRVRARTRTGVVPTPGVPEARNGVTAASPSGEARRRVHASLVGTHLPKLAASGLVEYDGRTVALPAWTSHDGVLGSDRAPVPWARYYAAVGAGVWVLIAATVANVPPFATLSWGPVAVLAVAVALAVSTLQYASSRRTPATPFVAFESLVE